MKLLRAFTFEVDDAELAISEILEQLDLANNQLAHSVGIVSCHPDFIDSGVLTAVSEALPFDVVGATSLASATDEEMGIEILTLAVLTSDEVSFTTALTESLWDKQEEPIKEAYDKALATLPEKPSLILTYQPMMNHVGGEKLATAITDASGGAPLFGTLTCDHNFDFSQAYSICNGKHYKDRLVMVLFNGPVSPRFFHIAIEVTDQLQQKAVITGSAVNVLKSVNDMPAVDFMASLGLASNGTIDGSVAIPFLVDYNDGTQPVCRGVFMITEEGWAVCGGDVPEGALLSTATLDYDGVMHTTGKVLDAVLKAQNPDNCLLVVSCNSRSLAMGIEPLAEMELVHKRLGGTLPYHMLYSGGEICPVHAKDGIVKNRFHNFSFTACLL
ncbi:FIST C-terminal domain-containing protein [Desulfovibrio sp. OttesenSCG-928-F20]|nr:FIST C-terminal domain-containing protein [Desulfovibrio sp. OttesenSCG-928-M16]MDL2291378.1 FIST C-terminal domain-containing protein [Desulfovibrio sp. OttesenSCG-928-F20]